MDGGLIWGLTGFTRALRGFVSFFFSCVFVFMLEVLGEAVHWECA